MIEGTQVELKALLKNKLSIADAKEMFEKKYDLRPAELLEQTIFDHETKIYDYDN